MGVIEEPDVAIRFSAFRELRSQEDKTGFVEARPDGKAKFFRAGTAGGWRSALGKPQVAQLIEAHRETLLEFGYLTETGEPRT